MSNPYSGQPGYGGSAGERSPEPGPDPYPGAQPAGPAEHGWDGSPIPYQSYGVPQQPTGYGGAGTGLPSGYGGAGTGLPPGYGGAGTGLPPGYGGTGYAPGAPPGVPRHGGQGTPGRGRGRGRGRRKAKAAIAVAAAVVVAAVAGVAYYLEFARPAGRSSATGSTNGPAPPRASHSATPPVTHHGDLRKYLIAAPSSSNPWPHPLGTNEKLSLTQAANLSSNSKARRRRLTADHFVQGAVRSWVTAGGTWIDVRLYQFGSAADAQSMYLTDVDSSSGSTPVADQSSIKGVPRARAFADAKADSDGFISVVAVGVKGDVLFVLDVAEHSHKASLSTPDKLMQQQYGKL